MFKPASLNTNASFIRVVHKAFSNKFIHERRICVLRLYSTFFKMLVRECVLQ